MNNKKMQHSLHFFLLMDRLLNASHQTRKPFRFSSDFRPEIFEISFQIKSDFRQNTSAGFPLFTHRGIKDEQSSCLCEGKYKDVTHC